MFLIVGILIGLNLMVRVALGETRELQSKGYARAGRRVPLRLGEIIGIVAKSGAFLVVSVLAGWGLDVLFGSTIGQIFG